MTSYEMTKTNEPTATLGDAEAGASGDKSAPNKYNSSTSLVTEDEVRCAIPLVARPARHALGK